jgi:hypothetical protein
MFCVKCGSEIADDIQTCPKCGYVANLTINNSLNLPERKRHGFTTFWLIFSIISFVLSGSIYLFFPKIIAQTYNTTSNLIMIFGIFSIIGVVGNIFLLCWKKIGFWIIVGVSIVSFVLNLVIGLNIGQSLFGLIGVAIMWGVLHIQKNGKNTWEQLV